MPALKAYGVRRADDYKNVSSLALPALILRRASRSYKSSRYRGTKSILKFDILRYIFAATEKISCNSESVYFFFVCSSQ